jgi:GTP-binding protein HflX
MDAVEATLAELAAEGKQTVIVFNKRDAVGDPGFVATQLARFPGSVAISARTGEGMPELLQELEVRLAAWRLRAAFRLPNSESALLAELHRVGHVLSLTYEGDDVLVVAHIPPEIKSRLGPFAVAPAA